MRKILIFLPFLLAGLFILFIATKSRGERYALVKEEEVKKFAYGSGYVRNKEYVVVKSEVSGYIKQILVKEGDSVKRGQALAIIDSGTLDASIKEVSERLKLVRDRLKEGSDYLRSLESAIESARLNMENAKSIFERRERLFSESLIPKEAYEQSKTQYQVAQREYERLKSSYQDAVRSLKAEKEVLKAELQRLQKEKEKYLIRSPIEGKILKKFVNVGDYINHISQENRLFSIGSDELEVWLEVDEEYAGKIREGQRVILKVDALPDKSFEGRVFQVIREIDRARKLITVKVMAQLPEDIPSGATVDGQIEIERKKTLLIPASAYRDGYVLLYDGVRRVRVPVKVGERYGEYLEVLQGLKVGDKVIMP
ncbi:MAG: efflux RND transporter periplasmic adaptor subunit [Aquificaceae bacterium]